MTKIASGLKNETQPPAFYRSVKESAAYVGCHAQTLRKAFKNGEVGGFKRGRSIVFREEDLDKWMARFFKSPQDSTPIAFRNRDHVA